MSFDAISARRQFPIFSHHPDLVYLDNAATSQKPSSVIQSVKDFYEKDNSNVHRGLYSLSIDTTREYEGVRKKAASFIGSDNPHTIAFTKGTTESINIIATGFVLPNLNKGDNVVVSMMEHHSNFIPWQQICKQKQAELRIIPTDSDGNLNIPAFERLIDNKTKLAAVTHVSNVLGTINPIGEIISIAHRRKIPVLIDAAQSVAHYPVDVKNSDADFVVFSAHKMFGPTGTGVVYCKEKFHDQIQPLLFGGGAVKNVSIGETSFHNYPKKIEAGTSNISGVIGLGSAIDFINSLDQKEYAGHLDKLNESFRKGLETLGFPIIGNSEKSGSIISFVSKEIHVHDIATFLANKNIAIRAGHHCAQPLIESLGLPATVRISFTIYNTMDDMEKTIDALKALKKYWS